MRGILSKCPEEYAVSRIKHQCEHISAGTNITRQGAPCARPAQAYSSSSDAGSSCLWPLPRNLLKYSALMASIGGEYLLVHPNTVCLRRPVPHREPAPRQCLWCAASGLRPSHRFSLIPGRALHCAHVHCAHVCTVLAADRCSTGVEPAAPVYCFS